MNRGPFIHGMIRYSNVRNEKNRRYKKTSLRRKIFNLICFALGLGILIIAIINGLGELIIFGSLLFGSLALIPFITSVGKNMLMYEYEIAVNQKRAETELSFDIKRTKIGYALIFAPLYVAMFLCLLIPIHKAWIVPIIPICFTNVIVIILTAHTVEVFDFSTKKYKWIHILLHLGILLLGSLIRALIIYPIIDG